MRNVAPHAAETQLDTSGVGVPVAQGSEGMSADVDICAAADDGVEGIHFILHGVGVLENRILFVVQALGLILRLAADVNAEALVKLDVLLRDDDGEVRVAAAQAAELITGHVCQRVRQP